MALRGIDSSSSTTSPQPQASPPKGGGGGEAADPGGGGATGPKTGPSLERIEQVEIAPQVPGTQEVAQAASQTEDEPVDRLPRVGAKVYLNEDDDQDPDTASMGVTTPEGFTATMIIKTCSIIEEDEPEYRVFEVRTTVHGGDKSDITGSFDKSNQFLADEKIEGASTYTIHSAPAESNPILRDTMRGIGSAQALPWDGSVTIGGAYDAAENSLGGQFRSEEITRDGELRRHTILFNPQLLPDEEDNPVFRGYVQHRQYPAVIQNEATDYYYLINEHRYNPLQDGKALYSFYANEVNDLPPADSTNMAASPVSLNPDSRLQPFENVLIRDLGLAGTGYEPLAAVPTLGPIQPDGREVSANIETHGNDLVLLRAETPEDDLVYVKFGAPYSTAESEVLHMPDASQQLYRTVTLPGGTVYSTTLAANPDGSRHEYIRTVLVEGSESGPAPVHFVEWPGHDGQPRQTFYDVYGNRLRTTSH